MKPCKAASVRRIGEKWLRWIGDAMPCQSANAHQVPCTILAGMQPASMDFWSRMERKGIGGSGLWLNWCKRPLFAGELQEVACVSGLRLQGSRR